MDEDFRNRYRRDYTNEVVQPARPRSHPAAAPQPATAHHRPAPPPASRPVQSHQPAAVHTPPKLKKRRRRLWVAVILLLLIAGAAGGGYWYSSKKLASPIPVAVRASVNFPLLYPGQLPAGFHLDNSSFTTSGGVVFYSAVNASGTKIAFTDQQRPASFDFNSFYAKGLSDSTTFTTPIGEAAVGTANGKLLGSIATDQSWLLVSSTSKSVQSDDLKLILSNIKTSDR